MPRFSSPITRSTSFPETGRWGARLGNVYWGPLIAALLLSIVGMATVHSASAELPVSYLPRQVTWVLLGLLACAAASAVDYHRLVDQAPVWYALGLGMLVLVLFVGREVAGSRSWLGIGPFGGQPAEVAKLVTALLLTRILARAEQPHLGMRRILYAGLATAAPMGLIMLQPDMGSAAMLAFMAGVMVLVAGLRPRLLVVAALVGLVLGAGFWQYGMKPYQRDRIVSFLSPEADPLGAGYQVRQSKIAVGSGQLTGRGWGEGTQSQLRFLPERHTDFIMSVLAEEHGFLGVVTVLLLYVLYLSGAARIAARSRDRAGVLLIVGLVALFTFHAVYNTAMAVGLLPITGIPLPFMSYGGSFMLINFIATGLILNVDLRRHVNR